MRFSNLTKPDMIVFDYGGTLAQEPPPDFLRGWRAVFRYICKNPDGVAPEEAHQLADGLWQRFSGSRSLSAIRKGGFEIHEWHQLRTVFDALDLEPTLSLGDMEVVLMDHSSPSEPVPLAAELLELLDRLKISTGVISNIGWSGQALEHRLKDLFPSHRFAFVLASSEYGIRKPDPLLFQIALKKARLPGGKIWFCGDNPQADIQGAQAAGMFPVWYQAGQKDGALGFPHLAIASWRELMEALAALTKEEK
ncbi:HAD family hydrolase [Oscillospiraceae bacterium 42-9]